MEEHDVSIGSWSKKINNSEEYLKIAYNDRSAVVWPLLLHHSQL